tara:strand:+ start:2610 stop:3743 length:1134 start_codon:yes stop_codon:yes gene_type:complete
MKRSQRHTMGRHKRTFTPRVRTTRPLGISLSPNQAPSVPLDPPIKKEDSWYIEPPLASRLHQKSALGKTDSDGGIYLTPEEILFCHWHRHLPLPDDDWFSETLHTDPDLVARSIAFDVARSGGELVVPVKNILAKRNFHTPTTTWALRWNREQNFTKQDPVAHVRWAWTTDDVDWMEMEQWTKEVTAKGMLAELLVVDEELDVTMYRLSFAEISGNQPTWDELDETKRSTLQAHWSSRISRGDGWYIPLHAEWPWASLGVEHQSGRHLRAEEGQWMSIMLDNHSVPSELALFHDLMNRGVVMRPGFKYGSQWRIYDAAVGEAHAPWLLLPVGRAPVTWNAACLSVRLAEGVHKSWVCAFEKDNAWSYLQLQRWLPGR